jgi:hypothetical protein
MYHLHQKQPLNQEQQIIEISEENKIQVEEEPIEVIEDERSEDEIVLDKMRALFA